MAVYLGTNNVDLFGGQPSGGGNDLIVTVSWNSNDEEWQPDVSYADIHSAYDDGKTITVQVDVPSSEASADGEWNSNENTLLYWVRVYGESANNPQIKEYGYEYNSNGITQTDYYVYVYEELNLQTKSVAYTPSGSQQTDTITYDSGYNGLNQVNVTINAPQTVNPDMMHYATYSTQSGARKWLLQVYAETDGTSGWYDGEVPHQQTYTYNAVQSGTTVTPTESSQTIGGANYMMEGAVTVSAIPSNYVGSGVTQRSSSDLSASGATVTAPSGYYANNATYTISSGTAGTPTATKGSVSNHSVTVTPSVTNTTGYITGGTKTGTAVTVTASELASGNKAITSNGSNIDVVGYSTVSVDVPSGGSDMNVQAWIGRASRTANSYGATSATLTVAKAGTYSVSWSAWRSSSSGTMGTNLHVNNTTGTNQTTFTNTYGQQIQLTNQHYNAGDVLTLYATSGSSSRTINVANLIIEQTA